MVYVKPVKNAKSINYNNVTSPILNINNKHYPNSIFAKITFSSGVLPNSVQDLFTSSQMFK